MAGNAPEEREQRLNELESALTESENKNKKLKELLLEKEKELELRERYDMVIEMLEQKNLPTAFAAFINMNSDGTAKEAVYNLDRLMTQYVMEVARELADEKKGKPSELSEKIKKEKKRNKTLREIFGLN